MHRRQRAARGSARDRVSAPDPAHAAEHHPGTRTPLDPHLRERLSVRRRLTRDCGLAPVLGDHNRNRVDLADLYEPGDALRVVTANAGFDFPFRNRSARVHVDSNGGAESSLALACVDGRCLCVGNVIFVHASRERGDALDTFESSGALNQAIGMGMAVFDVWRLRPVLLRWARMACLRHCALGWSTCFC